MPQKLRNGEKFPERDAKNIHGVPVSVPAEDGRLTHLQFRRFAGCPICNLHLQRFVARYDEIANAGVREVVFFHSRDAELLSYQSRFPFDVVGDPTHIFYRRYGVEKSIWGCSQRPRMAGRDQGQSQARQAEARRNPQWRGARPPGRLPRCARQIDQGRALWQARRRSVDRR